jgi:glycosidase
MFNYYRISIRFYFAVSLLFVSASCGLSQDATISSLVPAWVKDAVFYHIFPERFANGDTTNDSPGKVAWNSQPTHDNYFGGDLKGIIDHLDYLQRLGVNALYMTPVFESNTNHKYQTIDYKKIDPHFGDDKIFDELVAECHKRKMHIVLDGVFNHTGVDFFAFKDVREKGKQSQYTGWYNIYSFPIKVADKPNYEGWWGLGDLPKLMTQNPGVRQYLFNVTTYWIERGIDGWRLDAANEVPHDFWKAWRPVAKAKNPNVLLIGELWEDAASWLQGDEFDGAMNYQFRGACVGFFALENITVSRFDSVLTGQQSGYPPQSICALQNLIGSHDTERFLTLCSDDTSKLELTVLFQMTYPGAPMIYYGDEIGITGGNDPDNRKTMNWDSTQWDMRLFHWYQKMIRMRENFPVFRDGNYQTEFVDNNRKMVGFWRRDSSNQALVVLNMGKMKQIVSVNLSQSAPRAWINLLDNHAYRSTKKVLARLPVPSHGALVLMPASSIKKR